MSNESDANIIDVLQEAVRREADALRADARDLALQAAYIGQQAAIDLAAGKITTSDLNTIAKGLALIAANEGLRKAMGARRKVLNALVDAVTKLAVRV